MKKEMIIILFPIIMFLLILLVNSLLNIFGLYMVYLPFILFCLTFVLCGFIIGKKYPHKSYLKGLLSGFIITLGFFLINIIFIRLFNIKTLYYYVLIITCTTLGSMLSNLKQ